MTRLCQQFVSTHALPGYAQHRVPSVTLLWAARLDVPGRVMFGVTSGGGLKGYKWWRAGREARSVGGVVGDGRSRAVVVDDGVAAAVAGDQGGEGEVADLAG